MRPDTHNLIPPADLPALDALTPHAPRMALRRVFQRGGAQEHCAYVLQLNAVRLADTAVVEYKLGREAVCAYHAKRQGIGVSYIIRASGHFESCVWAFERFIKHAKALRSGQFVATELSGLIPRTSSFLHSSVEGRVSKMRHCLAHLEGHALKGLLPQGSNIILLAVETGVCIGEHEITWLELVEWLTDMHLCASFLADYVPETVVPSTDVR